MRQTPILPPPRLPSRPVGLCRLSPVPAGCWSFPTLSLQVFPWMPGPIPRRLPRCLCPFLPRGLRPSPRFDRVGSPAIYPYSDFRTSAIILFDQGTRSDDSHPQTSTFFAGHSRHAQYPRRNNHAKQHPPAFCGKRAGSTNDPAQCWMKQAPVYPATAGK